MCTPSFAEGVRRKGTNENHHSPYSIHALHPPRRVVRRKKQMRGRTSGDRSPPDLRAKKNLGRVVVGASPRSRARLCKPLKSPPISCISTGEPPSPKTGGFGKLVESRRALFTLSVKEKYFRGSRGSRARRSRGVVSACVFVNVCVCFQILHIVIDPSQACHRSRTGVW